MRKRRRKKKKLIFLSIFTVITITSIFIALYLYNKAHSQFEIETNKEEYIKNILSKNTDEYITEEFLIWIGNNYSIDTLLKLDEIMTNNSYNQNIWHDITGYSYTVIKDQYEGLYDDADNVKFINNKDTATLSFVGDVSLADNWYVMPKYDERQKGIYGILSEETVKVMTESDILVVNNEFTVSDRGAKMPGKYYTFRASPKRLSIYNEMGADLLTLANNHVYDFGEVAFYDMLDALDEYNIPYIGAGKNIEEAKKPYYFIINGYKIAFVNATRAEKIILTPEAGENSGGVFRCYNPEPFINLIKETKKNSDYVIALIHWGRENSHELESVQIETSKLYIDAGADIIIGTHAHTLQGIGFYNDKPIIYNIGDFIFNNESKDTGIFQIKLDNVGEMSYYFIPAYQSNEYTTIIQGNARQKVIDNINSWSTNAKIDEYGKIEKIK